MLGVKIIIHALPNIFNIIGTLVLPVAYLQNYKPEAANSFVENKPESKQTFIPKRLNFFQFQAGYTLSSSWVRGKSLSGLTRFTCTGLTYRSK